MMTSKQQKQQDLAEKRAKEKKETMSIRLSSSERTLVEKKAEAKDMKLSAYIGYAAVHGFPCPVSFSHISAIILVFLHQPVKLFDTFWLIFTPTFIRVLPEICFIDHFCSARICLDKPAHICNQILILR